jgi:hypothetical protein
MRDVDSLGQRFTLAAIAAAALAATAFIPLSAQAADALLSGSISSAAGEKLAGVTVSAKAEGATITTTVFTDEAGNYYFPPMAEGKYKVWAQAITFDTGRGDVALGGAKRQDFALKPLKDFVRQLPGDMVLAALPDGTPEDATMKTIVQNNCTACHTPSYILQHKFDEAGWNAIINLMKHANVYGIYQGVDHKASPVLDHNQKQLAAYLARARGPGESSMKFNLRPRPTGEAARSPTTRRRPIPMSACPTRCRPTTAPTGRSARRPTCIRASACMTPGSMPTARASISPATCRTTCSRSASSISRPAPSRRSRSTPVTVSRRPPMA